MDATYFFILRAAFLSDSFGASLRILPAVFMFLLFLFMLNNVTDLLFSKHPIKTEVLGETAKKIGLIILCAISFVLSLWLMPDMQTIKLKPQFAHPVSLNIFQENIDHIKEDSDYPLFLIRDKVGVVRYPAASYTDYYGHFMKTLKSKNNNHPVSRQQINEVLNPPFMECFKYNSTDYQEKVSIEEIVDLIKNQEINCAKKAGQYVLANPLSLSHIRNVNEDR